MLSDGDGDGDGGGNGQVANGGGNNGDSGDGATPTPTPVAAEPTESPVDPDDFRDAPAGFSPAVAGEVTVNCTPELDLEAVFNWTAADPRGEEQRLEVDFSGQRFATPPFLSSQSLDPDSTSLTWRLPAGFIFSWRVITKVNGGWVAGEPDNVPTAACPPFDRAD